MRLSPIIAAAVLTTTATPSPLGAEPATYPVSRNNSAIAAWLRRETDIDARRVVAINDAAVTSIVSTISTVSPTGFRVAIRSEVIDPEVFAQRGVLSWNVTVQLDCARRRLRLGPTIGYADRNLLGEGRTIRAADADWVAPTPGAPLDNVWRSLCEAGYAGPLAPRPSGPAAPVEPAPAPAPKTARAPLPATPVSVDRPASGWRGAVQIAAVSSEAAARKALAGVRARFPSPTAGLSASVSVVTVGERRLHRAAFSGFRSAAQARGLCDSLLAAGQDCLVRPEAR